jgi:hypothetical protein
MKQSLFIPIGTFHAVHSSFFANTPHRIATYYFKDVSGHVERSFPIVDTDQSSAIYRICNSHNLGLKRIRLFNLRLSASSE